MSCDFIDSIETIRVTRVNACGAPVSGADDGFVTDCFGSLTMAVALEENDDRLYKAPNGSVCAIRRGCPSFLGYDITLNLQQFSPELADILTGQPLVMDFGGDPVGYDSCNIQCSTGFALEFWTSLIGQNCTPTGIPRYLYGVIPWISNAYFGDLELGEDATVLELIGSSRAGGTWGEGPYNVVAADGINTPGPMLTPLGATCHRRMQITTIAPPVASCDYTVVPVPAP